MIFPTCSVSPMIAMQRYSWSRISALFQKILEICQFLILSLGLHHSTILWIFFSAYQRRMLITNIWVLICATLAYKSTEKMEACCLHKFQEHCSSWVGTIVSEHYQKAPRKQYKTNLIHAVKNVWGKKKSFYINTVKTLSCLSAWNAQESWWGRTAMETFFPAFWQRQQR